MAATKEGGGRGAPRGGEGARGGGREGWAEDRLGGVRHTPEKESRHVIKLMVTEEHGERGAVEGAEAQVCAVAHVGEDLLAGVLRNDMREGMLNLARLPVVNRSPQHACHPTACHISDYITLLISQCAHRILAPHSELGCLEVSPLVHALDDALQRARVGLARTACRPRLMRLLQGRLVVDHEHVSQRWACA